MQYMKVSQFAKRIGVKRTLAHYYLNNFFPPLKKCPFSGLLKVPVRAVERFEQLKAIGKIDVKS